jgi:hypothetical protein
MRMFEIAYSQGTDIIARTRLGQWSLFYFCQSFLLQVETTTHKKSIHFTSYYAIINHYQIYINGHVPLIFALEPKDYRTKKKV